MPLYTFRCPQCEATIDALKPINYTEGETCKFCGVEMKKLLGTGTRFKYRLGHFFEPYYTSDITGDPVLVKSLDHLHTLTRQNGLVMKPGPEKLR